ncbi:DNA helicase PcrA [Heliorestis acidaminivorans]|uniref:ATP-dependent DNA helicase n=1 Tax=Heliorestis acidaminivorans TaxID=553427 RepID=A0A6I0ESB6_9FIRM|nr:DNA helicase PcrA [Heliorestis acidaminivorans]KAB2952675.1 DNA helicase PcrA [Heliorestis acidaminivorans]
MPRYLRRRTGSLSINYNTLNPEQQKAVEHQDGPLLILAGAGSGKTRVLTYRIARLIEKGVSPFHILAITFTNKAAGEMKERLRKLIGPEGDNLWVSTFHSAAVRILRRDGDKIGYHRNFVIYDSDDQLKLIKECLKELNIDDKRCNPQAVRGAISSAKNMLSSPQDYERKAYDYFAQTVAKVYHLYDRKLRNNVALDFDDLLLQCVRLFQQEPSTLAYYQNRFRYIHIDEYQDTNHVQYLWVKLLAREHRNLCVVGDDDQSVYGWRGADIKNILDFERDYADTEIIKLEQNYRSTSMILNAANAVVSNNCGRKKKRLWTDKGEGQKIALYEGRDEHDESRFIVRTIEELVRQDKRNFSDFAILYRTNAQSRVLEEHLLYSALPYRILGGLRFYERKEIKDIIAYLRFISNPADEVSMKRIINVPKRGIGDASIARLFAHNYKENWTLSETLQRVKEIPGMTRAAKAIQAFHEMMEELRQEAPNLLVTQILDQVLAKTGYMLELQAEGTEEAKGRIENIKELRSVTQEFDRQAEEKTLEEFLASVSLVSDTDQLKEEDDAIVLMTMHSAKGLEFPVVFVAGMEEGVFPHNRALMDDKELEEERRLCYVAITRAEEKLFLTSACERTIFGNTVCNGKSRFFEEIPADLTVNVTPERKSTFSMNNKNSTSQFSSSTTSTTSKNANPFMSTGISSSPSAKETKATDVFVVGDKAMHGKFGQGVVVKTEGSGENQEISVAFPEQGIKKFLLKFAPLKKI